MSDRKDKVIYLAFSNPELGHGSVFVTSCKNCQNKTWVLVEPNPPESDFPTLKCACCGIAAGRIGWVHDADNSTG